MYSAHAFRWLRPRPQSQLDMLEIAQATLYVILRNDMLELGAVHEYTSEKMRSLLVGLRWSTFEAWMRIMGPVIRGAQLCRQPGEVEVKGVRNG